VALREVVSAMQAKMILGGGAQGECDDVATRSPESVFDGGVVLAGELGEEEERSVHQLGREEGEVLGEASVSDKV
jgi:hypothetical protein